MTEIETQLTIDRTEVAPEENQVIARSATAPPAKSDRTPEARSRIEWESMPLGQRLITDSTRIGHGSNKN